MFRDLPTYPEMHPTGLPWAQSLPAHWRLQRAKQIMRAIDVRSADGDEELLTVSSRHGVIPRATATVSMFKAETYAGHKLCWPDDLVINSLWAWGRGLGVARHHGIVSTAYGVYRQRNSELYPAYLDHLVRSDPFQWELQVRSQGVWKSRLQITDQRWLDAPMLLPPADEQGAIVKYLAHANARIDKAINAKRRLLSLLDEEARQLTTDLVTGGLGHRVVDSGADLPEGWLVCPFLRTVTERADYRGATPEKTESGVILVTAKNVRPGWIDYETSREYVSETDYPQIMRRGLPRVGDLLLTMEAPLGNVALVDREDVALAQRVVRFRLDGEILRPRFASAAMNSPYFQYQLTVRGTGSTALGIKASKLPQLLIALPPVGEQDRLLGILDQKSGVTTAIVARVRRELDLLQEFRVRLVSDVVTGQVDVRAIAATLPDEPDTADNQISEPDDDLEEALNESEK